jgi:hypothetical protein
LPGGPAFGFAIGSKESEVKKATAAVSIALVMAAAAAPAFARVKHHRHVNPAPLAHSRINSGWGPPMTWDEIEVSHSEGAQM